METSSLDTLSLVLGLINHRRLRRSRLGSLHVFRGPGGSGGRLNCNTTAVGDCLFCLRLNANNCMMKAAADGYFQISAGGNDQEYEGIRKMTDTVSFISGKEGCSRCIRMIISAGLRRTWLILT